MILIGLGANLPAQGYATPRDTLEEALRRLDGQGTAVLERSPWYRSAPVPAADQPWFVNGVARLASELEPTDLMARLHGLEAAFGRRRQVVNQARPIDLDLLAFDRRVSQPDAWPILPHPRLCERAFVLRPLADVAPDWHHPVSGLTIRQLIEALPADQQIDRLETSLEC